MTPAVKLSQYFIKSHRIDKEIVDLRKKKNALLRKFILENEEMRGERLFVLIYKIFGSHLAIKWYNRVYFDEKDIVAARLGIKTLVKSDKYNR